MKSVECLRCGTKMSHMATERIQLGETGILFRDLSHLISGSLGVEIYVCEKCKKLEFFSTDEESAKDEPTPKRVCPECGDEHDFDYPKCPRCKYDYYRERG